MTECELCWRARLIQVNGFKLLDLSGVVQMPRKVDAGAPRRLGDY